MRSTRKRRKKKKKTKEKRTLEMQRENENQILDRTFLWRNLGKKRTVVTHGGQSRKFGKGAFGGFWRNGQTRQAPYDGRSSFFVSSFCMWNYSSTPFSCRNSSTDIFSNPLESLKSIKLINLKKKKKALILGLDPSNQSKW